MSDTKCVLCYKVHDTGILKKSRFYCYKCLVRSEERVVLNIEALHDDVKIKIKYETLFDSLEQTCGQCLKSIRNQSCTITSKYGRICFTCASTPW
jgi:hypothetical protein